MKKKLIFVTVNSVGGVLDYTNSLASIFKKKNEIKVIKTNKKNIIKNNNFNKSNIVILQYSGYGFANKGAPFWLLKEIISLKKKVKKIIVIFHELYAVSYYPWKSAFWMQCFQKFIIKKLLKISDYAIITTKHNFNKYNISNNKKTIYLPIFSTVGEMIKFKYKKENLIVVFGLSNTRTNTYKQFGINLFIWAKINKFKIIDVGPKITDLDILDSLKKNNVQRLGLLKIKRINYLFKKAKYGLLDYNLELVDKSSVLNAYGAYGVIPIINDNKRTSPVLKKNFHYLSSLPKLKNKNNKISKNIWDWYQTHSLIKSTNKISNMF